MKSPAILELDGAEQKVELLGCPKSRGLWLWIELQDGRSFEAVYPSLDILNFSVNPVEVELREETPSGGIRPKLRLEPTEIRRVTVLRVIGSKNLLTPSGT